MEYEGLNLICFSCGKYGHHKEACPSSSMPKAEEFQNVNSRNSTLSSHENEGNKLENKQEGKEETFGSWMLVKKRTRNKQDNKRVLKGDREKRYSPTDSPVVDYRIHNKAIKRGSQFDLLGLEEVGTVEDVVETPLVKLQCNVTVTNPHASATIEKNEITVPKVQQMVVTSTSNHQQTNTTNGRQNANKNMLKSKIIMERFVKVKGGGDNKSVGPLKASALGTFKNQKYKKPLNQ